MPFGSTPNPMRESYAVVGGAGGVVEVVAVSLPPPSPPRQPPSKGVKTVAIAALRQVRRVSMYFVLKGFLVAMLFSSNIKLRSVTI